MQNILYLLDCARYYKIRQMIVLILRPSEHAKTSTSKRYISRSTCLKFNLKTVLNSDNHGGSNSRTAALIITLAKSVLSPLAAPLCSGVMSVLRESDDGRMSRGAASCNQDLGDSAVSRKFGVRHCESVTSSPFWLSSVVKFMVRLNNGSGVILGLEMCLESEIARDWFTQLGRRGAAAWMRVECLLKQRY